MRRVLPLLLFLCYTAGARGEILKVKIDGLIDPITAEFVAGAVRQAEQEEAQLLLIQLSTPGGLAESMRQIVGRILNSRVPVVCHVEPKGARAASAGFFILLAADVAVMAPGTNTGAAHPVFAFGAENKTMMKKVMNDALASLRSIVKQRQRNYELAEKGVVESKSYTADEALEGGLIDFIAQDEPDLMKKLEGFRIKRFNGEEEVLKVKGQPVRLLQMTFRQKVLSTIAHPNMALLLGVLGALGLYLEFTTPGVILPGVLGGISLILALLGFSLLPINLIGVLLILLAAGLFVAEVKVQGFGVLGAGGIVSLVLGLLFLVDAPEPEMRIGLGMALSVGISFSLIMLFLVRLAMRAQTAPPTTGREALVGRLAQARTRVDSEGGKVFVAGEWWEAVSRQTVPAGSRVRVIGTQNLTLLVEPYIEEAQKSQEV